MAQTEVLARRQRLWWRLRLLRFYVLWPYYRLLEPALYHWLVAWHGRGDAWQAEYYRCHGCQRLVTHRAIKTGGCRCGLSNKLSPARLRLRDKVRLLVLPWSVVR